MLAILSHLRAPPSYVKFALVASLAGLLFGFDTGSIGPITVMKEFRAVYGDPSPTLHGVMVSMILITAAASSLFAGPVADRISRTYTVSLGAALFGVGSLVQALAGLRTDNLKGNLATFLIGRSLSGIGEGLFLTAATVYIIEISPAHVRGRVTCIIQLYISTGVVLGYFLCYGTVRLSGTISWRLGFVWQAVVAGILAASAPFLPHSPRWLLHVGRREEASKNLDRMGMGTSAEREKQELLAVGLNPNSGSATPLASPKRLFEGLGRLAKKENRGRAAFAIFMMAFQQTTGIDAVLYYAPVLFQQAGLNSQEASFLASGVTGLVNLACTIVAQFYSDKWGRRPTFIYGGSVIVFTMVTIGAVYASDGHNTEAGQRLVIASIYLFVIAFSTTWSFVTRLYAVEIQPVETRATVNSLAMSANWVTNYIIAFTTPMFLARSSYGPYFFFGACTLLAVVIYICFMPETQGVGSLENMDAAFRVVPLREFLRRLKAIPPSTSRDDTASVQALRDDEEGTELTNVLEYRQTRTVAPMMVRD